jgi:hypothetical protein
VLKLTSFIDDIVHSSRSITIAKHDTTRSFEPQAPLAKNASNQSPNDSTSQLSTTPLSINLQSIPPPRSPSTLKTHNNHVFPPRNLPPPIPGHWNPSPPHPTRRLLYHHPHPRHIRLRLRQRRPPRREPPRPGRQPLRRPRAPRPTPTQGRPGQRWRTDQGRRKELQLRQRIRTVEER